MSRPIVSAFAFAAAAFALAACTTPEVQPTPSKAVQEARARHNAARQASACPDPAAPLSVGFGFGEATLSDVNAAALATAAAALSCHPDATVFIVGQADGHGTEADQVKLAHDRAQVVADDLEKRGVAEARLKVQVQGTAPSADEDHVVVLAEGRRW